MKIIAFIVDLYCNLVYLCIIQLETNLKLTTMKTAEITKTVNKLNERLELAKTDAFYKASLGYQRISILPVRVRRNINIACVLKGESNDNSMKEFLNSLTEQEFINWLKVA